MNVKINVNTGYSKGDLIYFKTKNDLKGFGFIVNATACQDRSNLDSLRFQYMVLYTNILNEKVFIYVDKSEIIDVLKESKFDATFNAYRNLTDDECMIIEDGTIEE